MSKTFMVTGGCGFIGSAVVRELLASTDDAVVNVDKLTYAGNPESLADCVDNPRYTFAEADIVDATAMEALFAHHRPDVVIHLAAESHVDRSIDGPGAFVQTNVVGTYTLLEAARQSWLALQEQAPSRAAEFRFLHVSTDEVYGDLAPNDPAFSEVTPYAPSSPYSASKAGSDHLVRAWQRTFGLPTLITNCSNNYGPRQFPEKLIPLMILNGLAGEALPVYGDGQQVRDWLYVEDHARALLRVVANGEVGTTYNIGGNCERTNLQVVEAICDLLDELAQPHGGTHRELIQWVTDRPGHDRRYAIDTTRIEQELGWRRPRETFETGLRRAVEWYLANREWCERVQDGRDRRQRLGIQPAAREAGDNDGWHA